MVHTPRVRSLSVMIALLCLLSLGAQRSCEHESRVYALTAESDFAEGCFAPLMCPVILAQAIGGTFRLSSLPEAESGALEEYAITDVYWLARIGGEDIPITGSGTYRIGGVSGSQQQMVLSLRVGDAEVQVFDSGLVPVYSPGLAVIDVVISINGQTYLDTVIGVQARAFREPGETFCGASNLGCNPRAEICVGRTPVGPAIVYSCEPAPAGCEEDRSCACAGSALCQGAFYECTEAGENQLQCECPQCQ